MNYTDDNDDYCGFQKIKKQKPHDKKHTPKGRDKYRQLQKMKQKERNTY